MQLKSLSNFLQESFLKKFVLPVFFLMISIFLFLVFYNVSKKNNDDINYVEKIHHPLINSMLLFQRQEAQMLLNSIAEYRSWTVAYLISNDNIIFSSFPFNRNSAIGRVFQLECNNQILLKSKEQIVGKICYKRSLWDYVDATLLGLVVGFLLAIFFGIFFYKNFLKYLEYSFSRLKKAIDLLEISSVEKITPQFIEEEKILNSLHEKVLLLKDLRAKEKEKIQSITRLELAEQVTHDIRSPLDALQTILNGIKLANLDDELIIQSSIQRINDIAQNLLRKSSNPTDEEFHYRESQLLDIQSLVEVIIREKKIEYSSRKEVVLSTQFANEALLIKVNKSEFLRVLSNLINNSYESINDSGEIVISIVSNHDSFVKIVIKDNGKGIPSWVLEKIGERGFSVGKNSSKSGTGLGLYYAKKIIESFNGRFEILSEQGQGTSVIIMLPKFFNNSNDVEFYDYVFIDNDELSRLVWKNTAIKKNVKLLVLAAVKDFKDYEQYIDREKTQIYLDSNLGEDTIPGELFAEELYKRGFKNIFMATGHPKERFSHLPWLQHASKKCPF